MLHEKPINLSSSHPQEPRIGNSRNNLLISYSVLALERQLMSHSNGRSGLLVQDPMVLTQELHFSNQNLHT